MYSLNKYVLSPSLGQTLCYMLNIHWRAIERKRSTAHAVLIIKCSKF